MSLRDKIIFLLHLPRSLRQQMQYQTIISREILSIHDMQYRDLLDIQSGRKKIKHNNSVALQTQYPVAYESPDHVNPLGTIQDNTRNYAFYKKCYALYGDKLAFLDLGCSGGGLVFDFALNGHVAIGLEGSDRSQKMGRANWRTIPDNLFTCDITKSFSLINTTVNGPQKFEVISCWEVLEHISENKLPQLINNIKAHLTDDGIFIGSVSKISDDPLHVTVQENAWWVALFKANGLDMEIGYNGDFEFKEFCRGIEGGMFDSHNYRTDPNKGFHFVAKLRAY